MYVPCTTRPVSSALNTVLIPILSPDTKPNHKPAGNLVKGRRQGGGEEHLTWLYWIIQLSAERGDILQLSLKRMLLKITRRIHLLALSHLRHYQDTILNELTNRLSLMIFAWASACWDNVLIVSYVNVKVLIGTFN